MPYVIYRFHKDLKQYVSKKFESSKNEVDEWTILKSNAMVFNTPVSINKFRKKYNLDTEFETINLPINTVANKDKKEYVGFTF